MAPEQAEGRPMDHRGDLFSLGSVLYALCTGRPPFWADSAVAILKRVCEDTPRPIRDINPDVPPWLVEIIARLHAKDPAARFASAAEVADLLGRRLAESQQPPEGTVLTVPAVRPRRRRWILVVAALLVLVGGLTLAEVTGVTRFVPALLRAVHGPAGGDPVAVSREEPAPAPGPPRDNPRIEPKGDPPVVPADMPRPQLAYQGQRDLGDRISHRLTVVNRDAFPDALFQASPDLPAIGLNKAASRTVIDIYDAKDDRPLWNYVASQPAGFPLLENLQFEVKKGDPPPRQVYVVLKDRKLQRQYRSNPVAVGDPPFVVLARAGRAEQRADTLAEAVRLARDSDTIEVRADGPFAPPADPIVLRRHPLRIRAGAGYRPVFHVTGTEEKRETAAEFIACDSSPLVLEGLDFQQIGQAPKPGAARGPVVISGGPVFVANCRFAAKFSVGNGLLSLTGTPQGEVRNCQLIASSGVALNCSPSGRPGRTVLRNNLVVASYRPVYVQFLVGGADAELQLTRNTFVGAPPVFTQPYRNQDAPPDAATGPPTSLRVEASGNIFDGRAEVMHVWFPRRAEKPAELIQQRAGWKGDHNLFAADACLSARTVNDPPLVLGTRLADWRQFWGDPETGSVEGRPRYLGGDVLARGPAAPEQLTPEDLRLHPQSAGRGAGLDGQDLGADVDLVGPGPAYERWQKTPDYQQWLKQTDQDPGPVAAGANDRPFVILARAGRAEKKLDNLGDAVRLAWDGDTVEVRGNGPFVCDPDPIVIKDHAVRIRAAEGFRPVFHVRLPEKSPGHDVITSYSPVVLEGLEFQVIGPDAKPAAGSGPIISSQHAPVYVANCRFVGKPRVSVGAPFVFPAGSPRCEVRNCQLVGVRGFGPVYVAPNRTVLRNNVIVATDTPLMIQSRPSLETVVQLTRNTIVGKSAVWYWPIEDPKGTPEPAAGAPPSFRVEASGNLFDGQTEVMHLQVAKDAEGAAEQFRRQAGWKGDHNLFAANACLTAYSSLTPLVVSARLADWRRFWGDPETGSVEDRPRYLGGDVYTRASAAPERLTPEDLRLHPESVGRGAGPGGEDLGADVDLVGPGPAYERWRKTPDYQQWLKDTGEVAPPAEPGAFVVLGGRAGAERPFDTLAEAVAAAESGDAIEVRGNGPFTGGAAVQTKTKALTIRAGAGFRPVLQMDAQAQGPCCLTNEGPLVLEGLEFRETGKRRTFLGGVVVAQGPLYVANCRFVLAGYSGLLGPQAFFRCPVCAARNCQFVCDRQAECGSWVGSPGGRLLLENNVLLAPPGAPAAYPYGWLVSLTPGRETSVRLVNNSVLGRSFLIPPLPGPLGEPGPVAAAGRVDASGNVFDAAGPVLWVRSEKTLSAEETQALVRRAIAWQGRRNVHAEGSDCLGLNLQQKDKDGLLHFESGPVPEAFRGLAGWEEFWGLKDTGSRQGRPRYQGGDVLARAAADPASVSAADCRLAADSAGKGAGEGGRDLGADVDVVGPGPSYERWQKTPDYQEWLKLTGRAK
jgi:hypothetical protein